MTSQGQTCVDTPILDTLRPPGNLQLISGQRSRGGRSWAKTGTGVGGAAGTLTMACPVCNPLAIPIFGAAGVLSFLAPYRGLIALLSIVLLAITLLIRLRTTRTCQLAPQAGPSPGSPR